MEILYWSPTEESEENIFEKMKKTYKMIHTYQDKKWYGESYLPADKVLKLDENRNNRDILKDI